MHRASLQEGLLLAAALLASATTALADPIATYQPGRGLQLFDGKLVVGGYGALAGQVVEGAHDHGGLSDLSAMVSYSFAPVLKAFVETELENGLEFDADGVHTSGAAVHVERAYFEYEYGSDASLTVRAGQMLTPFGIWNEIHALPLVWTTSRPTATTAYFDPTFTGLQVSTSWHARGLDFTAGGYGQATKQIDQDNTPQRIRRGGGARFELGDLDRWLVGVSFESFRDLADRRWENVNGIDASWRADRWELSSECAVNDPNGSSADWATYLQLVYHLGRGFSPVLRYEHVDQPGHVDDPVVIGVAYKPRANMIFKLEGVVGRGVSDEGGRQTRIGNGGLGSFAVLF